jgi:hypothetical protein
MEVSGQLHAPATLHPGEERPGSHLTGDWVGPYQESNPGLLARNVIDILVELPFLLGTKLINDLKALTSIVSVCLLSM